MTIYINRKQGRQLETVDECATRLDADALVLEYNMSDPAATYYTSKNCTADWKN